MSKTIKKSICQTVEQLPIGMTVLGGYTVDSCLSISDISQDRISEISSMYPNLMHPACTYLDLREREFAKLWMFAMRQWDKFGISFFSFVIIDKSL